MLRFFGCFLKKEHKSHVCWVGRVGLQNKMVRAYPDIASVHFYLLFICIPISYLYKCHKICVYNQSHVYHHIYIYKHIYRYTNSSICVDTGISQNIYIYIYIHTHLYIYTYIDVYIYVCMLYIHSMLHYIYIYIYTHVTLLHTCIRNMFAFGFYIHAII